MIFLFLGGNSTLRRQLCAKLGPPDDLVGGGEGSGRVVRSPQCSLCPPANSLQHSPAPHPAPTPGQVTLNAGPPGHPAARRYPRLPTDAMLAFGDHGTGLLMAPSRDALVLRADQDLSTARWDPSPFWATLEPLLDSY